MDGFHTQFGSPSSIAAYNLTQNVLVRIMGNQGHGSHITLAHGLQPTSKFWAMQVKNLDLRKGAQFQPPISFPILMHG